MSSLSAGGDCVMIVSVKLQSAQLGILYFRHSFLDVASSVQVA